MTPAKRSRRLGPHSYRGKLATVLASIWLLIGTPVAVRAQLMVEIGGGVTAGTDLVTDSIVTPFSVGMDPGFAAVFRVATRLDSVNVLLLGLGLSRNTLVRKSDGSRADVTTVNVWFPSVGLRRPLVGPLLIRGNIGALIYDAEETSGTPFRDGSPVLPAAGVGITFVPSFTNGLSLDLAWDIHRFNTSALKSEGFGGDKVVHRLSVMIQLGGTNER